MYFLDCTLRDGGYYNKWDFENNLVQDYLKAMDSLRFDFVEIGFRSLKNDSFKGGLAYSNDSFLKNLTIPSGLVDKIGVMINGSEIRNSKTQISCLEKLFSPKVKSPVSLVRVACHANEFRDCLPASKWLKDQGYLVGFNLMQVAHLSIEEITKLAKIANDYPIDVLYFADSMGSLEINQLKKIIKALQKGWRGDLGIHTHDNMGQAVSNTTQAVKSGITWVDSTVTGMGRGPGNAQTEYIIFALANYRKNQGSFIKLFEIINKYFKPMQKIYEWGINPFYYLSGQLGIHPTYIQEMMQDNRFSEEDILTVIEFLKKNGGKKFSINTLEAARLFYSIKPKGKWKPSALLKNKIVLILGSGPSIKKYGFAIENFIEQTKPYVIALNTQSNIKENLVDARIACHPIRILADYKDYLELPQPLIIPLSMLPRNLIKHFADKKILDFGLVVNKKGFKFHQNYCELPTSLVMAYSLAVANSGKANQILLAGFDGYEVGDSRLEEIDQVIKSYKEHPDALPILSVTPTNYEISTKSIFGSDI